jgi:uracil-DNA glycosylase
LDNALRLQYLEAMGIQVWAPRVSLQKEQLPSPEMTRDHAESETTESVNDNWAELQAEVTNCSNCSLCATRTQTVFGSGNRQADWMLVGEAPGQHEDEQGEPFVGKAGLLLTEMLRSIGLSREEVFITNILKCRPPNNRDPKAEEVESCKEYLLHQQRLIQPKIILAVGRIAAQTLLNTNEPISRLRGKVHTFNNTPVVVVYHPAYLLRSLSEKRKAWQDLQFAVQTMNDDAG